MDPKKERKQLFKEMEVERGVYTIKNKQNGKVLVVATRNFKTMNGKRFELENGSSTHKDLQHDWQTYGKEAFAFDICEKLPNNTDAAFNEKKALRALEEKWLEKLQPYGERGYHKALE
ncbi:hypothetical protein A374_02479 [Fictibacillus macauensis ZFHKF-1]|uniref:Uncharacterized protein n=1 Tax=Fictibacillus macauensis ZFHKF-1 TaxID=1196324 RepID=I8UJU0_9BACL|nr:GIY-YIG nuclease family protein [Fictibacillus macauensis]EIT87083.1 hypothetical protein A374_02479 [Fictibacillus macauensis ZFHKF-1]